MQGSAQRIKRRMKKEQRKAAKERKEIGRRILAFIIAHRLLQSESEIKVLEGADQALGDFIFRRSPQQ